MKHTMIMRQKTRLKLGKQKQLSRTSIEHLFALIVHEYDGIRNRDLYYISHENRFPSLAGVMLKMM